MALPTSRNTTYAALSQVKGADLNDIQDQIITLDGRATAVEARADTLETASETTTVIAQDMRNDTGNWSYAVVNTGPIVEPHNIHTTAGNDYLVADVNVPAGKQVSAISIDCELGTATANAITAQLYRVTSAGVSATKSDSVGAAASTARQTITLTTVSVEAQSAGEHWFVLIMANANINKKVYTVTYTHEYP